VTTWIFQENPDRFDIDGYLTFAPRRIAWLVNQYRKGVLPGDQVFLWRARGSGSSGPSGVIAECLVDSPVLEMEDDPSSVRFKREANLLSLNIRFAVWFAEKAPWINGLV
jgi:hypothetical protein